MGITKITYTKDWTNPSDFPTVETSEAVVRSDMQNLYDQVKTGVNLIVDELEGSSGAANTGITPITGVAGTTVQGALEDIKTQIDTKASTASLTAHTSATTNPHSVTKAQVGLGNVDNTADLSKPISTATQTALDLKESIASADNLISNVTFTSADGKFTFTKQGGSTIVIDTNLEKVPGTMALVEDPVGSGTYYLVIYDRSTPPQELSRCPVTALFNAIQVEDTATVNLVLATGSGGKKKLTANVKDGSITNAKLESTLAGRITTLEAEAIDGVTDTDTIDFSISNHKISGYVKDGSITSNKLASGLYSEIEAFATRAETAATNAEASESNASDYATNAGNSATAASGSATSAGSSATAASLSESNASSYATGAQGSSNNATAKALIAEGYSSGTQNGVPVESTSPYYHNNSKWYMEHTDKEIHSYESVSDLPAVGVDGDLYIVKNINTTYRYSDTSGTYIAIGQVVDEIYVGTSAPTDPNVKLWIDTTVPSESGTLVQSINGKSGVISKLAIEDTDGLQTALDGKQSTLTFDSTPTYGSTNPVTSGGIRTYVDGHTEIFKAIFNESGPEHCTPYEDVVTAYVDDNKTIFVTETPVSIVIGGTNEYPKYQLLEVHQNDDTGLVFYFAYLDQSNNTTYYLVLNSTGWTKTTGFVPYQKPSGGIPDSDIASASVWNGKQNALTFDSTPTSGSDNPVTSQGIKAYSDTMDGRRTRRNITSNLSNLSTAIAEQNLEKYGYSIGDYFVGASGYVYHLADMDTYYGGYNYNAVVNTHHCGIVVDTKSSSQYQSSGSVSSYSASTLHSFLSSTALNNIKSDITALFGSWQSHLLSHTELDNAVGGWGTTWTGLADTLICALSEVQVYGANVFSCDAYQTGTACKPLNLFMKYRHNEIIGNTWWWLRSLFSASVACAVDADGIANHSGVTNSARVVGLILFH